MSWVLDASAAVEVLLRTDAGETVIGALGDDLVLAPELLDAEVLSVLRRICLAERLDAGRASEAIEDLRCWDIVRLRHAELLDLAWAHRHDITAYDALYVAAAERHGASLLTADGPLARAPSARIPVLNVPVG